MKNFRKFDFNSFCRTYLLVQGSKVHRRLTVETRLQFSAGFLDQSPQIFHCKLRKEKELCKHEGCIQVRAYSTHTLKGKLAEKVWTNRERGDNCIALDHVLTADVASCCVSVPSSLDICGTKWGAQHIHGQRTDNH